MSNGAGEMLILLAGVVVVGIIVAQRAHSAKTAIPFVPRDTTPTPDAPGEGSF